MNSDDRFEDELRTTLDGLAREPAPEGLISRVAAIPEAPAASVRPEGRLRRSMSVASGLAAIAAVVAIGLVAIALRPAGTPPVGASPSAPIAASPSLAIEATPSPTPTPASVPTPTPPTGPTPTPKPTLVSGAPVPADFRPMSVTFVSSADGWVLGSAPCASGRCPVIAHTLDGGRTWTRIPAPTTTLGGLPDVGGRGIAGLRFANARDGWAFGPDLWATHDGGITWSRLDVLANGTVVALETARGSVHAVFTVAPPADAVTFKVASSPTGTDDWSVAAVAIPVGAGPVPAIQLVLSGDAGWILQNDRVVENGARLVAGTWRTWQPVCADVVGPAFIGASSASDLVAVCDVGLWSTPAGEHLFVSRDAGVSFAETRIGTSLDQAASLATPDRSTIVIAGFDPKGWLLVGSFDAGRTWSDLIVARPGALTDLGFTTTKQGVVISTAEGGASQLLMTRDGGKVWSAVTF